MKFWVGVTDNTWFNFQQANKPDEVNFWQPSATPPFKNAPLGMPFLFKLKKPNNHIAGGGFFVTYSTLPVSVAWDVFGEKNGANSLVSLLNLLTPLHQANKTNDLIGCTILASPFFFPESQWIETPSSFASNIVRGKMYDTENNDGSNLWANIQETLNEKVLFSKSVSETVLSKIKESDVPKYGNPYLTKPRIGQGSFRLLVTDAYKRRCAITGESTLPVLEAAHIVPYSKNGTHDVSNGLLLRADFHKLFDAGLVTVMPDLTVKISSKIKESYFNGKAYYRLQDCKLAAIPEAPDLRPNPDYLDWHNRNCFIQ